MWHRDGPIENDEHTHSIKDSQSRNEHRITFASQMQAAIPCCETPLLSERRTQLPFRRARTVTLLVTMSRVVDVRQHDSMMRRWGGSDGRGSVVADGGIHRGVRRDGRGWARLQLDVSEIIEARSMCSDILR